MDKQAFDLVAKRASRQLWGKLAEDKDSDQPKRKGAPESKDILNMQSTRGRLADYLSWAFGGDRAGRATNMALAAGRKAPFKVRHPVLGEIPYALGGNLAGSLAGAAAGYGLSRRYKADLASLLPASTAAGGVLGAVTGLVLARYRRRKAMKGIAGDYDHARYHGDIKPVIPTAGLAETALLPLRGPHRRGQQSAYDMIAGNSDTPLPSIGLGEGLLHTVGPTLAGPAYAPAVGTLVGYGQNIGTYLDASRARERAANQSMGKQANDTYLGRLSSMARPYVDSARPHLQRLQQWAVRNPELAATLAGGAAGGAIGAMRSPTIDPWTGAYRGRLSNALSHGLTGAAGAGIGVYAAPRLHQLGTVGRFPSMLQPLVRRLG